MVLAKYAERNIFLVIMEIRTVNKALATEQLFLLAASFPGGDLCHEGEVKVQLDSEYALTVKLVDTKSDKHHDLTNNGKIQMKSN